MKDLEAEGLALLAEGFARLAKAARARTSKADGPSAVDWIPAAASPLGRKRTLALARSGELESSKVGRKVLISRASLEALLEAGRRGEPVANANDDEDLFGRAS